MGSFAKPSGNGTNSKMEQMHGNVVNCLPHLRAFALLLARERSLADDLVQDTIVRALSHVDQFQPGTNIKAWLTTILRNAYFSEMRRRGRASRLGPELMNTTIGASGGQVERLHGRDCRRALNTLPPVQREALLLVGASGFSYEEAGHIAGCAVGTMKSRVSRARLRLQEILDGSEVPLSAPPIHAGSMGKGTST